MEKEFELHPKNRKSFYGKAIVKEKGLKATLYSYDQKVMTYDFRTKKVEKFDAYDYSKTTKLHQKAFYDFYEIKEEV